MTPELRAAAERVRRHFARNRVWSVETRDNAHEFDEFCRDLQALTRAYLTEHPAGDDEPPSMVELEELFADPLFPPVERDGKRFAFVNAYVEIQTKRQLRQLQEALHP